MKKKLLKSVALLMCVVITCLSMPLGSSAAGKVYTVDEFSPNEAVCVETNKSETIAFFTLLGDDFQYAITKNGKDYSIIDFNKYLSNGKEFCGLLDYSILDDTFVFLVAICNSRDYSSTKGYILTTTDFNKFNQYTLPKDLDYDTLTFNALYFDFVDDVLVLGCGEDFYETNSKTYFSGIYYTSKDFTNWEKHNTPKTLLSNEYPFVEYTSLGDVLVIELSVSNSVGKSDSYAYSTTDFKNYTTVFGGFKNNNYYETAYISSPLDEKIVRVDNIFSKNYYDYVKTEIVLVDINNGNEEVALSEKVDFWHAIHAGENLVCVFENNGKTKGYSFDINTKKFNLTSVDYRLSEVIFYGFFNKTNDCLAFYANDKLCLAASGNPLEYNEYDISSFGFDEMYIDVFQLNGRIYIVESVQKEIYDENYDDYTYPYKTKVAETDITIQKKGDLNGDSQVNSTDALVILQSAVGKTTLSASQKAVADVNKDGNVNSTDALKILQFVVGKISTL